MDLEKKYEAKWVGKDVNYPDENLIRILKGSYPRLNFDKNSFKGKKICDVSCGNGRNMVLLAECGFKIYGTEVTQPIVEQTKINLSKRGIKADIRVGKNSSLPFENEYFDYLLSWNACYYIQNQDNFSDYIKEHAKILKTNGYFILSIPKNTCFIYDKSEKLKDGYQIIKNDPFKIRNGEVMRIFKDEKEIESEFSKYFKNFIFGSSESDFFGLNYHWHLVVCQKK